MVRLSKRKVILILTISFIVGTICLILGIGLDKGWNQILTWFSSKWAIMWYVAIGIYVFIILYVIFYDILFIKK